jgi:hypothetical protein
MFYNVGPRSSCMAKLNEARDQIRLKLWQKLNEMERDFTRKLSEKERELAEYKNRAEVRQRSLVSVLKLITFTPPTKRHELKLNVPI